MRSEERPSNTTPANTTALLVFVSALVLVDTVFFTALTPLLPHYKHILGLSKTGAGILVAAYPVGTLLGSLPGGVLATRLGVRTAVVFGLFFMSGATLVFGFGTSITVLDGRVSSRASAVRAPGPAGWRGSPPARRQIGEAPPSAWRSARQWEVPFLVPSSAPWRARWAPDRLSLLLRQPDCASWS